jgi:hypothetical protein
MAEVPSPMRSRGPSEASASGGIGMSFSTVSVRSHYYSSDAC